jgi:hypothetical protein
MNPLAKAIGAFSKDYQPCPERSLTRSGDLLLAFLNQNGLDINFAICEDFACADYKPEED